MEPRLSLVTLGVADLDRARAFYEALGFVDRASPDEGVVFFNCGGMVLALWGLRRLDRRGLPVATIGMGLLARGTRNPALSELLHDLRRAVARH
jgi:catechol 2,3-dioxygenase-like lactoylglutathione lyase family enzyme